MRCGATKRAGKKTQRARTRARRERASENALGGGIENTADRERPRPAPQIFMLSRMSEATRPSFMRFLPLGDRGPLRLTTH